MRLPAAMPCHASKRAYSYPVPTVDEEHEEGVEPRPLVLIIEPNADVAHLLVTVLRDYDLRAVAARSAAQARAIVAVEEVQLAVIEIRLPDGNGISFGAELKAAGIAVILTGGHPEAIEQGSSAGSVFLAKPFRITELLATVLMMLPT